MAEYIEREALMRRIKEIHCSECNSYHGARCRACWVDDTLGYIDCEPCADVSQARHGKWLEWFPGDCALIMTGEEMLYRCSSCDAKYSDAEGYKYCPNCGAKMEDVDA